MHVTWVNSKPLETLADFQVVEQRRCLFRSVGEATGEELLGVASSCLDFSGGLAEAVSDAILHSAFIPFGDIKDMKTPLD